MMRPLAARRRLPGLALCLALLLALARDAAALDLKAFASCPPFSEKDVLGCTCRRAVLDAEGNVFHQGFFKVDEGGVFPLSRTDCHPCPDGATCMGGRSRPAPLPGYWANPRCPVAFSACEANLELGHSFICLAPNQTRGEGRGRHVGECREGHQGILCHKCAEGYGRDEPSSPFCVKCKGLGTSYSRMRLWHLVFLGAKVVFEAGMSLSLIFTGLEADKRNKPEMSQLLKAGLSYLGIVKLLLSGNTHGWPRALQLFISTHAPPNAKAQAAGVTSFDCWFSQDHQYRSVYSYALQIVPSCCSLLICALYLYAHSYRLTSKYFEAKRKQRLMASADPYADVWMTPEDETIAYPKLLLLISDEAKASSGAMAAARAALTLGTSVSAFARNLLPRVAIVCCTSVWPSVLAWALGFFACSPYPKSFVSDCDEASYDHVVSEKVLLWEYDKDMECYTGLHSKMLEYAGLPVLVIILFPLIMCRFLWKNGKKMFVDDKFDYTYGFLYRDYEAKFWFWEFIIQGRTLALTALVVYVGGTTHAGQDLQGLCLLVVIVFSTLLHTRYLPYVSDMVDHAQQIVLVDAAVLIISSMFFKLDPQVLYWAQVREVLGLAVAALHVGTLLVIGLLVAKAFLKTYAMSADADGDNVVSDVEAAAYFGHSPQAKVLIKLMEVFKLVETEAREDHGHRKKD